MNVDQEKLDELLSAKGYGKEQLVNVIGMGPLQKIFMYHPVERAFILAIALYLHCKPSEILADY